MRAIIVGASQLSATCAKLMVENKHEVVIIEKEKEKIEEWSEELDCGFVHGNGSRPSILKEVDPKSSDCIIFLSDSDTDNILGGILAKSMDFKKVILKVDDADLRPVCLQLKLEHVIFPDQQIAQKLLSFLENK